MVNLFLVSNKPRGFTILELIITLAIAGVILHFASDNYARWITSTQAKSYTTQLLTDLQYARQWAITHRITTTLCPFDPDTQDCGNDWTQGYAILQANTPIRIYSGLPLQSHLSFNRNKVSFNAQGHAPGSNGTFIYTGQGLSKTIEIVINVLGRAVLRHSSK